MLESIFNNAATMKLVWSGLYVLLFLILLVTLRQSLRRMKFTEQHQQQIQKWSLLGLVFLLFIVLLRVWLGAQASVPQARELFGDICISHHPAANLGGQSDQLGHRAFGCGRRYCAGPARGAAQSGRLVLHHDPAALSHG